MLWEWDSTPICKDIYMRMCENSRMDVTIILFVWVEDKNVCFTSCRKIDPCIGVQRKLITSCLEVLHVSTSQLELRCTTTSSNLAIPHWPSEQVSETPWSYVVHGDLSCTMAFSWSQKVSTKTFVTYYTGFTQLMYIGSIGKTLISFSIVPGYTASQTCTPSIQLHMSTRISWSVSHESREIHSCSWDELILGMFVMGWHC